MKTDESTRGSCMRRPLAKGLALVVLLLGTALAASPWSGSGTRGRVVGGDRWEFALENPITVPITFKADVAGYPDCVGSVRLNGLRKSATNIFDWYTTVTTAEGQAQLEIYKTYELWLSGDSLTYRVEAFLAPPRLHDLLQGPNAAEYRRYALFLWQNDRWVRLCEYNMPAYDQDANGGGDYEPFSAPFLVQVRPDPGARPVSTPGATPVTGADQGDDAWGGEREIIDASVAPGDGEPLRLSAGKEGATPVIGLEWAVSLGRLYSGKSAGKLRLIETQLTTNTYTPNAILYVPASTDTNELEVLTSLSDTNQIQQSKAPQTLVNVETLSSNCFELQFYLPAAAGARDTNGFYTLQPNSTNFVAWRIESPSGAGTNKLQVSERRPSQTNATLLEFTGGANLWTLTQGTGTEARVETRTVTLTATNRLEVVEVRTGGGVLSDRTAELYHQFPWGYELLCVTNDLGGSNLITAFTYCADSGDQATYRKLTAINYPDGHWERRSYSDDEYNEYFPYGAPTRVVRPWMNSSPTDADNDCWVTSYQYAPTGPTVWVHQWHDALSFGGEDPDSDYESDHQGSKTYAEATDVTYDFCESQGVQVEKRIFGGINHYGVERHTKFYTAEYGRLGGHKYAVLDGSGYELDAYDYQFGAWDAAARLFRTGPGAGGTNDVRQVIYHGAGSSTSGDLLTAGDSGAAIEPVNLFPLQSTKEVKIIQGGNLVARELYVYVGGLSNFARVDQVIYQRDCLGHSTNVLRVDPGNLQTNVVIYRADWQGTNVFPTDFKLSETDRTGAITRYVYDSLKRVKTATQIGVTNASYPTQLDLVQSFAYDAAGRVLTNSTSSGALTLATIQVFDRAGRLKSTMQPGGFTTTFSYPGGGRQTNIVFSSGAALVISNYLDRRVAALTGTAAINQFSEYALTAEKHTDSLYPKNIRTIRRGNAAAARLVAEVSDQMGTLAEDRKPAFRGQEDCYRRYFLRSDGRLGFIRDRGFGALDQVETWFDYSALGERIFEGTDGVDEDTGVASFDPATTDRVFTYSTYYQLDGSGYWHKVTEKLSYPIDDDATPTLVERTQERLTGLSAGILSETSTYDSDTNHTFVRVMVDFANKKVTATTTNAQSTLTATNVVLNGRSQTESTLTVAAPSWHYYDPLGREIAVKNPLGFATGRTYNGAAQVIATTNLAGQVTAYTYYPAGSTNAGQLYCEAGPTGKRTFYNYNGRGQTTHIWGDAPYPEQRGYNDFGDLVTLITYRSGSEWAATNWPLSVPSGDTNTWQYDEPTGLLTNKTDALNHSVYYTYYENHFPRSRQWARGLVSTNYYSANGDLLQVDYAEDATITSVVLTNYSRLAQPRWVGDASGEHVLTYDHAARLLRDACTNGLLSGVTVSNRFERVKGKDRVQVQKGATTLAHNYGFDTYGRLAAVTNGACSSAYAYLAGSDLIASTLSTNTGAIGMLASRTWDYGYRLRSLITTTNSPYAVVAGFSYLYDALDRRTQATIADSSRWVYAYNDRDEVIGGKRSWVDWSPVTGQQFEYGYDPIGNRTLARWGGDTTGGTLRTNGYTVNALNQYTTVTNQGYKHVCGAAIATNAVAVNGSTNSVDRRGEYFHRELTVANGSTPVWQTVSLSSGGTSTNLGFAFPKLQQALTYDADGNLTFDGIWAYRWDGENRLVEMAMTNVNGVPNAQRKRVLFKYDHLGRRVSKAVSIWTGAGFGSGATTRFVYDLPGGEGEGWRLLAEVDAGGNIVRSYTWGLDLSGTLDGAGGIGGLLFVTDHGGTLTNHFVAYDGNGNVAALVRTDSTETARYEYGPFGELIRATGPIARTNPFRWSTKFWDEESELVYYGYRYYNPAVGRWISRDPLENENMDTLYGFLANRPLSAIDPDGRFLFNTMFGSAGSIGLQTRYALVYARIYAGVLRSIAEWCTAAGIYAAGNGLQCATRGMNAAYWYASVQTYAAQTFTTQAAASAYVSARVFLANNSEVLYNAASAFTGFMGPPTLYFTREGLASDWGTVAGNVGSPVTPDSVANAINKGLSEGQLAAQRMQARFQAFLDDVTGFE